MGVLSATNCGESVELTIQSLTSFSTDPQYLMLGRCGMYNAPTSTNVVPLDQWVQVAVTVSNNYLVSYFIGGTNAGAWTNNSGYNLALGTNITLADNSIRTFNGMLDEVQIWDIPLSQAQITNGMNQAPNVPDPNLVGYWPFNEGQGTTTADASGNGQTGTLVNSPTWVSSGVPFVPDATTSAATGIGRTNSTLNGTVNPCNLPTTAWFQWGADTHYGNLSSATNLAATNASLAVSAALPNLAPGQTCHFCVVATNNVGTNFGSDMVFTTRTGTNTVTTLADSGPGSLRQTIAASLSGDTILFATNGTITLTSGEIEITNDLTITGPGATNLAISGNSSSRVFNINNSNATVAISSLTIRNGNGGIGQLGGDGGDGGNGGNGGAVYSTGSLTLDTCAFSANAAGNGGAGGAGQAGSGGNGGNGGYGGSGGSDSSMAPGGNGGNGGAVYSTGSLALTPAPSPLILEALAVLAALAQMASPAGASAASGASGAMAGLFTRPARSR